MFNTFVIFSLKDFCTSDVSVELLCIKSFWPPKFYVDKFGVSFGVYLLGIFRGIFLLQLFVAKYQKNPKGGLF